MIKRPNLRIHRVEEETEIQTKSVGNLLNEIIAENFPSLFKDLDTHVQEGFQTPNRRGKKRTHHIIIK
jgi:hypothetical protein